MSSISPDLSAALARSVYDLTKFSSIKDALESLNNDYGPLFCFSENDLVKAKTGGPWFIKCQTAFGFTLLGKGRLQGHAFFIFRGTQYLADWLTNLNVVASRGAYGQPVHDGFNSSFKTMQPQLIEFMKVVSKSSIAHIHCIGHSLGGALATLCGSWIHSTYSRKPFIYSYGSPRVGLHGFSKSCTAAIGAERIFRAYHKTDVVPCIPIWPYFHTPISGYDYYLPSPGFMPMAEYHGMDHYVESVHAKTWNVLAALQPEKKTDFGIVRWLDSRSPKSVTADCLEWLSHAIFYVLKKCTNGSAWIISEGFATSFTLMDQLAYILTKGVNLAENISILVLSLIQKILAILGMKRTLKAEQLTREFIRNVLMRLQFKVNEFTQAALSKVLVQGRSM